MHLYEIMDSRIGTVSANDYALEALRIMTMRRLSWCFVLDRNQVAGIIRYKDLARLSDAVLKEQDVREYVMPSLVTVSIDTELKEAKRILQRCGQHFVGVVKNDLPVGILTLEAMPPDNHTTQTVLAHAGSQRLAG